MSKKILMSLILLITVSWAGSVLGADPANALIGHWMLDGDTQDSSGLGNDGTAVGGPTYADGMYGQAIYLDGSNDYVNIDEVADDFSDDEVTLSAWINTADEGTWVWWFSCNTSSGGNVVILGLISGQIVLYENGAEIYSPTLVNDSQWYHVAYTRSSGTGSLYINGVLEGTHDASFTFSDDDRWSIGQEYDGSSPGDYLDGLVDDVRIYDRALTEDELLLVQMNIEYGAAYAPSPSDGQTDVPRDVVLSWTPGEFVPVTNGHTLYFSDSFEDVNNGVDGIALSDSSSVPSQSLEFGTTYYWRVDEVNGSPDYTVYEGNVWSFTTESYSYAVTPVAVTASGSLSEDNGPEKTIDESGLIDDLHGTKAADMWISDGVPATIQYEFESVEKLHEMWVWNSNQIIELFIGYGANEVVIETSVDGFVWTALEDVTTFNQAPGAADYAHNTVVDFNDAIAKYVRLTLNTVHGVAPQTSLSEVRFYSQPVCAWDPDPASGTEDVDVALTLDWMAGREADQHDVYLGTDPNALSCVATVESSEYAVSLDLGQTYYWQIVEINDLEVPTSWDSDIWEFTTESCIVIDDMESYKDDEDCWIFNAWVDGYDYSDNGSVVGNGYEPETDIVHNGSKSMPFYFTNTKGVDVSEATFTFDTALDWTQHNIQTLTLWFAGLTTNVPGQLFIKVNDVQVDYDGDEDDLTRTAFQPWNIELSQFGINLENVTTITIGIEGADAEGELYIDDVTLYPYARRFVTPVEPDTTGLIGYWKFDGDASDSSGLGNDGVEISSPSYDDDGQFDQAIFLDGGEDYVTLDSVADDITDNDITLSAWINTSDDEGGWWFSCNTSDGGNGNVVILGLNSSGQILAYEISSTEAISTGAVNDSEWHHIAYTRIDDLGTLYIDGALDATHDASFEFSSDDRWSLGQEWDSQTATDFVRTSVDEVQIYDRGLSYAEIAGLAGRTESFDKPFE